MCRAQEELVVIQPLSIPNRIFDVVVVVRKHIFYCESSEIIRCEFFLVGILQLEFFSFLITC